MTEEDFIGLQEALSELPYEITVMSRSGEVVAEIPQESFPLMWQDTAEILLSPALDGQFLLGEDAQYLLIRNEEEVYGEAVTFFYNITDAVMIWMRRRRLPPLAIPAPRIPRRSGRTMLGSCPWR